MAASSSLKEARTSEAETQETHPYKHSTSGPPEASHSMEASRLSVTGWHRGGLQGGPRGVSEG